MPSSRPRPTCTRRCSGRRRRRLLTSPSSTASVVGFALWYRTFSTWQGKPGLWLEDLFVRPEARGTGLGRGAARGAGAARGGARLDPLRVVGARLERRGAGLLPLARRAAGGRVDRVAGRRRAHWTPWPNGLARRPPGAVLPPRPRRGTEVGDPPPTGPGRARRRCRSHWCRCRRRLRTWCAAHRDRGGAAGPGRRGIAPVARCCWAAPCWWGSRAAWSRACTCPHRAADLAGRGRRTGRTCPTARSPWPACSRCRGPVRTGRGGRRR